MVYAVIIIAAAVFPSTGIRRYGLGARNSMCTVIHGLPCAHEERTTNQGEAWLSLMHARERMLYIAVRRQSGRVYRTYWLSVFLLMFQEKWYTRLLSLKACFLVTALSASACMTIRETIWLAYMFSKSHPA